MSEKGKVYDYATGEFTTVEMSIKATKERIQWEYIQRLKATEAPPEGYGLDGYPLQRGKRRADRAT